MTNLIDSRLNREKSKSQRTYAAYIDFKKCFDSVNREKLFQCLIQKGIPIQIWKIIFQIYQDTKYFIRSGDFLAESFTTTTGVPQGCKLSSILFSLYVANLPKCLHKKGPKLGNALINHLQYSDDLVLIGRTANELQLHLDKIEKHCSEIELEINIKRPKYKFSTKEDFLTMTKSSISS